MRKWLLRLAVIALVPGALLILAVVVTIETALKRAAAADPKWKPSLRVLFWARLWCALYRVPFALSIAVLHNEGASTPKSDGTYPLGDVGIERGPSVGAGQVERANVERLWAAAPFYLRPLVTTSDPLELADVGRERQAMWAHVQMLREVLQAAGGDLRDAARRYNGSGAAAEAYADRATDFMNALSA